MHDLCPNACLPCCTPPRARAATQPTHLHQAMVHVQMPPPTPCLTHPRQPTPHCATIDPNWPGCTHPSTPCPATHPQLTRAGQAVLTQAPCTATQPPNHLTPHTLPPTPHSPALARLCTLASSSSSPAASPLASPSPSCSCACVGAVCGMAGFRGMQESAKRHCRAGASTQRGLLATSCGLLLCAFE